MRRLRLRSDAFFHALLQSVLSYQDQISSCPKHLNFIFIRAYDFFGFSTDGYIWRLKYFRNIPKVRMMNDIIDRFKTDMSESDVLMPVLCSAWNILTVVNMKYGNLIFSYNTIELFYHIIKMMNNIIPTVARMTCIKTNSQFIAIFYPS